MLEWEGLKKNKKTVVRQKQTADSLMIVTINDYQTLIKIY